jgi:BNR repeat-like domain
VRRLTIPALLFAAVTATAAERTIPGAMAPYLAGDGRGGFAVSWFESKEKTVRVATLRNGTWSEPMTIAKGETVKANRADTPVIAVDGDTILATYSVGKGHHGRNVYVTRSTDAGKTWSKPVMPHPALESEFGFVSLTPRGDMIWLDGRGLPGGKEGAGDMQFHYARVKDDGTLDKVEVLDSRVCDCCPTSMVVTSAGPLIAYRDRSDDDVRDISVIRRDPSLGWLKPKTVHEDGWTIKGCPVNGPSLDARGADVALAWFTGADNDPRVYVAFSRDGGANFGKPYRVDTGKPAGRVDVAFDGNGVIVSWIAGTSLYARRATLKGAMGAAVQVAEAAGLPRLAVSNGTVAVAYGATDGVHFTTIELPRN